jgi:hypothetical protein
MTTNTSRLVDLEGEFPSEINIFPEDDFDVTWHITNSAIDIVG